MSKPKLIAIVGPTASGKTALAHELADQFSGELISVDSRQIYRRMDIGTAKDKTTSWGIDLIDPDQAYSVAEFKTYVQDKIGEILTRGHLPILVGGTGLWLRAVIDNLDLTRTAGDMALRRELQGHALQDLNAEFERLDPVGAAVIDHQNKRRVVRALEVVKLTGRRWSEQQTRGESPYQVLQIGLSVPREELNKRIDHRVEAMIEQGLIEEVRRLQGRYGCSTESMTGIGYRQVCAYLDGTATQEDAIAEIKRATHAYAKRQMTWFKRDLRIVWVKPGEEAVGLVRTFLKMTSDR
jgi:tRNA dimethylallyltransferase